MEFEIKDLEIIDGQSDARTAHALENRTTSSAAPSSLILTELHRETEELQNKLKLNYRRLLLFETENNKLIEEKNRLFFEARNHIEKCSLLTEKNEALEKQAAQIETHQKLLTEKISSLEKINQTQLAEIRRFSKFHEKIQQVVKPFILDLKRQILKLQNELAETTNTNNNLLSTYREHTQQSELQLRQKTNEINSLHAEKNSMIRTYEEQIHSFSKEIVDLQGQNDSAQKEIVRLKKAVEFKNYFENEVIRFKRTHEEDQKSIQDLTQKKAAAEARVLMLEQNLSETRTEMHQALNRLADTENQLETTRTQFSHKIDDLNLATERLARLEKLNNQLSHVISKN